MAEFDLSTLSGPELRGLLDSTRKRGQAAQAYRILQEMAARRARDEGGELALRPRTVDVDLSDPLEPREDPLIEPPPEPAPEEALGADLAEAIRDRRPRSKAARKAADKASRPARRKARRQPEPRWDRPAREPKRPRRWPGLVFAAGTALGVVVGVGIAAETFGAIDASPAVFPQPPAAAPAPQPAPILTPVAALPEPEVTGPPPVEAAPAPEEIADAAGATAVETAAAAPEPAAEPAPEPAVTKASVKPAPVLDRPDKPDKPEKAAAADKACAGAPADCAIRQDPRLQRLQKELRAAYAAALEAHEDRTTLRERQLAWRDARDGVADPDRLAGLYEARIRKLNAAAAEARRAKGG